MPRFADVGVRQSNTRPPLRVQPLTIQRQEGEPHAEEPAQKEQAGPLETSGAGGDDEGGDEAVDGAQLSTREGQLRGNAIVFDEIEVPAFKTEEHRGRLYNTELQRPSGYKRENTGQREIWTTHVRKHLTAIKEKLTKELPGKVKKSLKKKQAGDTNDTFVFKYGDNHYYFGTLEAIASQLAIPKWGPEGDHVQKFEVDHIVELQLGGDNALENMELLEKSANSSSGSTIHHNIDSKINRFITATNGRYGGTVDTIKNKYDLHFEKAVAGESGKEPTKNDSWRLEEILDGDQVKKLKYSEEGIDKTPGQGKVYVFSNPAGGQPMGFEWSETNGANKIKNNERIWFAPFEIVEKEFNTKEEDASAKNLGHFVVDLSKNDAIWEGEKVQIDVLRMEGEQHIGYIDKKTVSRFLRRLRAKGLSPIRVDAFDIQPGGGISARGVILPDVPLLQGQEIPFELRDGGVVIAYPIDASDLQVPEPFQIREALLQVTASSETGIGVHGGLYFGIDGVGEGHVEAGIGEQGLSLAGAFDFDSSLFDPARVELSYENEQFKGSGKLTIPSGKVPNIETATLDITVEGSKIDGKGTLKPTLPGFEQGSATLSYSPAEGLALGADVAFEVAPLDRTTMHLGYRNGSLAGTITTGISAGRIPGVESATLDVAVEGDTFSGEGTLEPAFPGLEQAKVNVGYDPATGLSLGGKFAFDSGLAKRRELELGYAEGKLYGGGEIQIATGRIPGVDAASLTIAFDDDKASGKGTLTLALPGLKQTEAWFSYSQKDGYRIGGSLAVADLPHVEQGELTAEVSARPGSKQYELAADGKLSVSIAGLKATAKADYQDGAFTVTGKTGYKRGLAAGTIEVGITNRAVNKDGKLLDRVGDQLLPFGHGSVTLSLTKWLTGTAGIRLLPNGELETQGTLEIPDGVELFGRKGFEKELFDISVPIPIFGLVSARIGGGMSLDAGVGPGTLSDASLGVLYNPDHPDQTQVKGKATFGVPADAGLTLFVRASLGAGVRGLDVEGGLEVSGRMGIEGALDTGVELDWTPSKGVAIDAHAAIQAQPRFRFALSGFVAASLLWEEWEKKWELASYEYGSALRFGMKVPIHYDSKNGFKLSWDDVELETPDIDTLELIKGLLDETGDESKEKKEKE